MVNTGRQIFSIAGAVMLGMILAASVMTGEMQAAEPVEPVSLDQISHIHGIGADPNRAGWLYLATHAGLYLANPTGTATHVGVDTSDFMGFAVDPFDAGKFVASGHPPGGGNSGVLRSDDAGESWHRVSDGASGPVDFHALSISQADPTVIYGLFGKLQRSRDGGRSWKIAGSVPEDTFDIAASPSDPDRVYAAARAGLFSSGDGGVTWQRAHPSQNPATLVEVGTDGTIYAFLYGVGLLAATEPGLNWEIRSGEFADRYLLQLTSERANPGTLHAVADTGAILTSRDGGRSWGSYVWHDRVTPERLSAAAKLYDRLCQACHGVGGVGERPESPGATDSYGFLAPALNDSAHAWHHSDEDLVETISRGSPRNPRMLPFEGIIGKERTKDLVLYLRSLWSLRSLACQGSRHMRCMQ